jgi:hypothetical protein
MADGLYPMLSGTVYLQEIFMEQRRSVDQTPWGKFSNELQRYLPAIITIGIMVALTFLLPATKEEAMNQSARQGILALLITVTVKTSIGASLAHLFRKWLFPFLDFQKLVEDHHWGGVTFLSIWYGIFVYAFAVGG